jgi:hypothetical protein
VPEAGQSEQTQRAKESGLWDTRSIWTMPIGVDDKECPNQGRHGLHFPKKGKKVVKGGNKRRCKCWKQRIFTMYRINKE